MKEWISQRIANTLPHKCCRDIVFLLQIFTMNLHEEERCTILTFNRQNAIHLWNFNRCALHTLLLL